MSVFRPACCATSLLFALALANPAGAGLIGLADDRYIRGNVPVGLGTFSQTIRPESEFADWSVDSIHLLGSSNGVDTHIGVTYESSFASDAIDLELRGRGGGIEPTPGETAFAYYDQIFEVDTAGLYLFEGEVTTGAFRTALVFYIDGQQTIAEVASIFTQQTTIEFSHLIELNPGVEYELYTEIAEYDDVVDFQFRRQVVPEPGPLILIGLGLATLAAGRR